MSRPDLRSNAARHRRIARMQSAGQVVAALAIIVTAVGVAAGDDPTQAPIPTATLDRPWEWRAPQTDFEGMYRDAGSSPRSDFVRQGGALPVSSSGR